MLNERQSKRGQSTNASGMRLNLLWYIPLFVFVVGYFALPNASAGYTNVRLVARHWTWGLLLSPSAYLFFATAMYSVLMPIQLMLFIPGFFSDETEVATYDRRYLLSLLVFAGIAVLSVVMQFVIEYSFPFCWQSDGVERMRILPFLPCPK
jgi:hypothetical protein